MSDFHTFVEELFAGLGPVRVKRMFGGAGVWCGELMFGLIAGDELYLRTDAQTKDAFVREGLTPFLYNGKTGKTVEMPYFTCPPRLFDDADEAAQWGRDALGAAQRAKKPSPRKRSSKRRRNIVD